MKIETRKYLRGLAWWLVLPLTIICLIFSCKKFVEIDPPVNEIISDDIFKNDGLAISAVTGIYSDMMSSSSRFSSGDITFYAGMSADELYFLSPSFRDEFVRNNITENSHPTLVSVFWEKAYKNIYTANICLEKMYGPNAQLSDSTRQMLEGECRLIRAFCYFHLVNLFGPIPLPMGSDFQANKTLPRSSISKVYELIFQDLEKAKDLLLEKYPTAERVRPNKYAALALLAKAYLYRNEWAKAEATSTQIINNTIYELESPENVFLKQSKEAIWQLLPVNTSINNTWEGNVLLPPGNTFFLLDTLVKSFEPMDARRTAWVIQRPPSGNPPTIRYTPAKYRYKTNPDTKYEYYIVFRLGEQYLIRSEARAHLNKIVEAAADLNIIRTRAKLPNTTANSQDALYIAIAQERKIELFAEWGNRWYDLKRTQRADAELKDLPLKKPGWTLNDTIWPIPSSQILANPNLTQNPGY